eukprot:TRINITY_DN14779_c0_g1_i1.p1 TRINITY_DN14779_c0_g1~~TRINITY_DN14779_c0_g1_i1.p1  ORF type:complete len:381 (-),score=108.69 TRINITY_DN14779_c0_g1_i1:752-1894(-)
MSTASLPRLSNFRRNSSYGLTPSSELSTPHAKPINVLPSNTANGKLRSSVPQKSSAKPWSLPVGEETEFRLPISPALTRTPSFPPPGACDELDFRAPPISARKTALEFDDWSEQRSDLWPAPRSVSCSPSFVGSAVPYASPSTGVTPAGTPRSNAALSQAGGVASPRVQMQRPQSRELLPRRGSITRFGRPVQLHSERSLRSMHPNYKSKYDPEMVILLRDFYTELVTADTLSPTATAAHRVKLGLGSGSDVSLHSLFGNSDQPPSFHRLLRRFFPLGTTRDYEQMFALAYPRSVPRKVRQLTDTEVLDYSALFELYDVDSSGTLTMKELKHALRNSTAFRNTFQDAGQLFAMFKGEAFDEKDGVTLPEFLEAMRQTYAT